MNNLEDTIIREEEMFYREGSDDMVILTNFFNNKLSGEVITYDRQTFVDWIGESIITRFHNACITKIIYKNPVVVVFWNDGTKTISKCHNESYDPEKGLFVAVLKKVMGNNNFRQFMSDWACESISPKDIESIVSLKDVRKRRNQDNVVDTHFSEKAD